MGSIKLTVQTKLYLRLVTSAKKKVRVREVLNSARQSSDIEAGYELTSSAIDLLIEQGCIEIHDDRLALGELGNLDWVEKGILEGDPDTWKIVDSFEPKNILFDPDQTVQRELGETGELFVWDLLTQTIPRQFQGRMSHVSTYDDSAGFDVLAPLNPEGGIGHLEIKTSTKSSGAHRFFISRNETKASRRLSNWYLVMVTITAGKGSIFGHLDSDSLYSYLPKDQHSQFEWSNVQGQLAQDEVFPGLPVRFDK